MVVEIVRIGQPTAEVAALLGDLDAELATLYIPAQQHSLTLDAVFQPHMRFFVARRDEQLIGSGGVALFDDFAEVKRMFVREHLRGQGIADTIMERLIAEARKAGLPVLRLETGIHSHAAVRFYERHGFRERQAFEPYASLPSYSIATSRFFERLSAP